MIYDNDCDNNHDTLYHDGCRDNSRDNHDNNRDNHDMWRVWQSKASTHIQFMTLKDHNSLWECTISDLQFDK